ncbi:MAG: DUF120 domain-containing protein [Halococcoides sp.]
MAATTGAVGHAERATLKHLALAGALDGAAKVSCASLARRLDVSDQTASRRLQRLEESGAITREKVSDGQWVEITAPGEQHLQETYAEYQRIFESSVGVTLSGSLTRGMGEGRHYVSLPGYAEQFERRLGYDPFPGTLNCRLDEESVRARTRMNALDPIVIEGWDGEERTYGPAYCYPATVEAPSGERASPVHVISPERTHHDETELELLAPTRLRDSLDLEDGDRLQIHVRTE